MFSSKNVKRVVGDWVFLEALEERSRNGIIIPPAAMERYPQAGRILDFGPRCRGSFERGSIAILLNEGLFDGRSYYQVCALTLRDWPDLEYFDIEVYDLIRGVVEEYRRNSSTHDKKIVAKTIDGSQLSFLASDVLDYQIGEAANPTTKLDYVHAVMFPVVEDGVSKLLYFVKESNILMTLE